MTLDSICNFCDVFFSLFCHCFCHCLSSDNCCYCDHDDLGADRASLEVWHTFYYSMMESLLRDGRSNIVIKFINDHDAKDHDHLNDHQVRWEGPECDGSHMSLKPRPLPSCQKQWRLVLPSGFIVIVIVIVMGG